uniref:signal peptidase I n=1 Tax=Brassica oleracea var. oleracea TaxID=109376 RepID=A0A0D3BML5_BRAOL
MVHERENTGEVDVLTKGDNNPEDDRLLYAKGQLWLNRHHIMGRAVGFLPYVGWVTIIMTEKPIIKYILIGMIVTSALIIWKALICVTGSDSLVVVVLSESMEPGFQRGDILFLHMSKDPIRAGEIVVFNIDGRDIPIVHRVIM